MKNYLIIIIICIIIFSLFMLFNHLLKKNGNMYENFDNNSIPKIIIQTWKDDEIPDKYKNISFGKIILKKHVILGSGSILMPNVILEEGVAVGALSFVNKSLKEWKIYIGCPVKILKERSRKIIELENELVNYIKS